MHGLPLTRRQLLAGAAGIRGGTLHVVAAVFDFRTGLVRLVPAPAH